MRAHAVMAALLLTASPALAAQGTGVVTGVVVEAGSGDPVAGAAVYLEGVAGAAARTDARGEWRIAGVSAGQHRVVVRSAAHAERIVALEVRAYGANPAVQITLTPRAVPLDAVVVTAGRRPQRLADVVVATEVISSDEIRRSGASDLAAVLTERAGVVLEGGHPAGSGIMLQGLGTRRVLVLLDGQPLVGRLSGNFDLSRIPASMVERVEIVKGPQSTLYGSEAMGGVVNIITRNAAADGWQAGLGVTGGSHGRLDLSGHGGGTAGRLSLLGEVGRRVVELTPGVATEAGTLARRHDALAKLGWTPAPAVQLETALMVVDERQRWRTGQLYYFADNVHWHARLGAVHRRADHTFTWRAHAGEFDHLSRRATAPEPVAGSGTHERQRLLEADVAWTGGIAGAAIDAGAEVRRETIDSDRVEARRRAHDRGEFFAQTTVGGERLQFMPGVRLSAGEPWGTHWSPRVATMFRPHPRVTLRASLGRGFRAPDFKELFITFTNSGPGFSYTVAGNPDLLPETATNVTAGAEWTLDRVHLRAQWFDNRFGNFIETVARDADTYSYANVQDGRTRGWEIEATATHGPARFDLGYAYLSARRRGSGEPLLGRPAHAANGALEYALRTGLRIATVASYTGRTPVDWDETATPRTAVERAAFLNVGARLSQRLPLGLQLSVGADNLLDESPDRWPGFAGRQLFVTVQWTGRRDLPSSTLNR